MIRTRRRFLEQVVSGVRFGHEAGGFSHLGDAPGARQAPSAG